LQQVELDNSCNPYFNPTLSLAMDPQRSVLITGCSNGGIGSALALAFGERGFRVYATARSVENMTELRGHDNVTLLSLGILNPSQIDDVVKTVSEETNGTLEYFVNNAGQTRFMPLLDEDIEAAKKLYDTNFWAPLQLVQAFSPLLIQSKGTVVFNTSVSGYLNVPWQGKKTLSLRLSTMSLTHFSLGIYAASKRSLEMLSDNF
jgi:1-acylglycerone phosphate reductase